MTRRTLLLVLPLLLLLTASPVSFASASAPPAPDLATTVDQEVARTGLPGLAVTVTRGRSVLYAGGRGLDHAGELFVSEGTVKTHLSAVLARLGVDNRVRAAVLWCAARR